MLRCLRLAACNPALLQLLVLPMALISCRGCAWLMCAPLSAGLATPAVPLAYDILRSLNRDIWHAFALC